MKHRTVGLRQHIDTINDRALLNLQYLSFASIYCTNVDPLRMNRSSTSTAATAFAIATSASSNPRDEPPIQEAEERKDTIGSPSTIRVLNVLRYVGAKSPHSIDSSCEYTSETIIIVIHISLLLFEF